MCIMNSDQGEQVFETCRYIHPFMHAIQLYFALPGSPPNLMGSLPINFFITRCWITPEASVPAGAETLRQPFPGQAQGDSLASFFPLEMRLVPWTYSGWHMFEQLLTRTKIREIRPFAKFAKAV